MNRKDIGRFLSTFFVLGGIFGNKQLFAKSGKVAPTPHKRRKRRSSGRSGIPTNQAIRMAQNRKQLIIKKSRDTEKRLRTELKKSKT